jgi:hypothetical protein
MAFSLSSLSTYYNGASSFLSALVTFLTAVQGNEIITHEAPSNWVYGIGVGISVLTGVLSHLKQAQPAIDSAGDVAAVITDIENVLNSFKAAPPTAAPSAARPVVPVDNPVVSAVNQATSAVGQVTKTATNIVDEITKVIQTYQVKVK